MTIVHPNKNEFPITTRILWQYQDEGPVQDSSIKEYSPNLREITLVSHEGKEDVTVEVVDVFITAVLDPSGMHAVSLGDKSDNVNDDSKIAYVDPDLHPVDTRLLVSYISLPVNAPERDVTVMAWNDDQTKVKLQVNVENGVLAWHDKNKVMVHTILEEKSTVQIDDPYQIINPIDHPFGTHLKIMIKNAHAIDVVVRNWVEDKTVSFSLVEDVNGSNSWAVDVNDVTIVNPCQDESGSISLDKGGESLLLADPSLAKAQLRDEFLELVDEVKMLGKKLGYGVTISL